MKIRILSFAAAIVLFLVPELYAANALVIESKQVVAGATNVTIGVYVTNDDSLSGFLIPIEIREVTPGSFIADTLALDAQNRLATYLVGVQVKSILPAPDNTRFYKCDGAGYATRGEPDFVSPEGLFFAAHAFSDPAFPVGNDGSPPGGTPSLVLTFNVTDVAGTFEIDTTCVTPSNHIAFWPFATGVHVVPQFTKGVIEIVCECDCHADPVCDSIHNMLDVVKVINVAFRGAPPIPDSNPMCPRVTTDVNCDDITNVLDVVLMNNVVTGGADPESTFCEACP